MTTTKLEQVLCASVMDDHTAKLSPVICTALAYAPEMWESPEAAKVAEGINRAIRKGRPTHRTVVAQMMSPGWNVWLDHPMFNDGLPLSCVEQQANDLLNHYHNKRIVAMLGKAYQQGLENPEKALTIALGLKMELEGVLCK